MNNTLNILKNIYKPYRFTIKGKSTLLETTSGNFIVKPKNKNIFELYNYLLSRGFDHFPKLIDASRKEVNVFEYVEDFSIPKEQKIMDLIDILASLHNKTSYFKEVSEDTYKAIYENIMSNINYLMNYYDTLYEKHFPEIYFSPSTYIFMRNYYKIMSSLEFSLHQTEEWYNHIIDEHQIRVCVVHNNVSLDHFLKKDYAYLISWDNYMFDTPIIDLVKLYKKEWQNSSFKECLKRYMYKFPLLDYEKELFFILISIPIELHLEDDEFTNTKNISEFLNYIFKTEELIRPYYPNHDEEEKQDFQ